MKKAPAHVSARSLYVSVSNGGTRRSLLSDAPIVIRLDEGVI